MGLSRSEMCPKRCQKYMLNITVGFGDWGGAKYSIIGRNYRRMRIEKQALCIGNWRRMINLTRTAGIQSELTDLENLVWFSHCGAIWYTFFVLREWCFWRSNTHIYLTYNPNSGGVMSVPGSFSSGSKTFMLSLKATQYFIKPKFAQHISTVNSKKKHPDMDACCEREMCRL